MHLVIAAIEIEVLRCEDISTLDRRCPALSLLPTSIIISVIVQPRSPQGWYSNFNFPNGFAAIVAVGTQSSCSPHGP